jgi:hypothetical protein
MGVPKQLMVMGSSTDQYLLGGSSQSGSKKRTGMILEGVAPVTSGYATIEPWGLSMGDLQDPKMEVLYHIKAISCGDIPLHSPYIGLIYMVGTSNLGS